MQPISKAAAFKIMNFFLCSNIRYAQNTWIFCFVSLFHEWAKCEWKKCIFWSWIAGYASYTHRTRIVHNINSDFSDFRPNFQKYFPSNDFPPAKTKSGTFKMSSCRGLNFVVLAFMIFFMIFLTTASFVRSWFHPINNSRKMLLRTWNPTLKTPLRLRSTMICFSCETNWRMSVEL